MMKPPLLHLLPHASLLQLMRCCCGSDAAAAHLLASSITQQVEQQPSPHASRANTSLLLHACDGVDITHPLHIIRSNAVEILAARAVQHVSAAAAAVSPSPSSSCSLFVAAAVAMRTGLGFRV